MRTRRSQSSGYPMPSPETAGHRTVLLHEAVDSLVIQREDTVLDGTLGGAGHSALIAQQLGSNGTLIGVDADSDALERAREKLRDTPARVVLINANFRHLVSELENRGIQKLDKALFDLGWSGYQLAAGRGFSFLSDEPLHMGYAKDQELSAKTMVNEWSEESLADIIFGWGEDRYARRVAKAIVSARSEKPIETARELAEIVKAAYPQSARHGKTHPATKTFQAIRIAVNDELGALSDGLAGAWKLLSPGGRIAVITFHSIEDRIVKRQFLEWEKNGSGMRVTKKPIVPSSDEIKDNPRSRSAKLRVIKKI